MKVYRLKVKVSLNDQCKTYYAPFVSLFPSWSCDRKSKNDFIYKVKLLFITDHPEDVNRLIDENHNLDDIMDNYLETNITYKVFNFNPLKNIYERFMTFIKYRI